jgi:hypothetical protein
MGFTVVANIARSNFNRFPLPYSLDLEEASVRTNLALSQKKLLNEMDGDLYEESEEYRTLCKNVVRPSHLVKKKCTYWRNVSHSDSSLFLIVQDKVTLKLIYNKICDGQLDAALGLVARLHLLETFDVAIKMSERFRHNKLSNCIEDEMFRRFPPNEPEMDVHRTDDDSDDPYEHLSPGTRSSQVSPEAQPQRHDVQHPDSFQVISKKRRFA